MKIIYNKGRKQTGFTKGTFVIRPQIVRILLNNVHLSPRGAEFVPQSLNTTTTVFISGCWWSERSWYIYSILQKRKCHQSKMNIIYHWKAHWIDLMINRSVSIIKITGKCRSLCENIQSEKRESLWDKKPFGHYYVQKLWKKKLNQTNITPISKGCKVQMYSFCKIEKNFMNICSDLKFNR